VKKFCAAVAANTGILYSLTNVGVEAKGQLAINNGPGDIADLVKGKQFAIGVFAAVLSGSHMALVSARHFCRGCGTGASLWG